MWTLRFLWWTTTLERISCLRCVHHAHVCVFVRACMHVWVDVRACMRACVRACVHACLLEVTKQQMCMKYCSRHYQLQGSY